jgi:RNA polymerase sigma factor (sigma-70 family)
MPRARGCAPVGVVGSQDMTDPRRTTQRAIEAVWRIESARVVAGLARMVGDVGTAEELAQDALVDALVQWPAEGVPPNPGGWLMTTAKHHAIDLIRRRATYLRKLEQIGRAQGSTVEPDLDDALDDHVGDDLLRLIFTACHPVLATEARVALTLKVLGGLRTDEIARALLVPESTVAQRIVRAKRALTGVAFELPSPAELTSRLGSVLEIIYLIFNEGYAATAGDDWTRPALCEEATRLGRVLAGLAPRLGEQGCEAYALLALMELQASRLPARTGPGGEPILLPDQDRRRWDRLLIRRGLTALERAEELGGAYRPYALQAAIAACHARAHTAADTDWPRIAALYRVLGTVSPSPVVELNRAVAVGMAEGPAQGLAIVDAIAGERALAGYPHLAAVRGDLLARLGRAPEARLEFARAAELTRNARERELFLARVAALA